jgi:hypothetical protein
VNGVIWTWSRGGGAALEIERSIHELDKEFEKGGLQFQRSLRESTAIIPEIVVSIIGGVSVYYITKLIDRILQARLKAQRELDDPRVRIFIMHQEFNIKFEIPEKLKDCEEHFRQHLEDNQEDRSHDGESNT